jgi:hypothetical protein
MPVSFALLLFSSKETRTQRCQDAEGRERGALRPQPEQNQRDTSHFPSYSGCTALARLPICSTTHGTKPYLTSSMSGIRQPSVGDPHAQPLA